ncbi:MAG: transglycosylase SLT domain-containing protein [Rhodocyclaceae bacterium]|nr:transglycosylase SLT domain-containing protein [Rhodocyclaceae bacterium]
MRSLFLLLAVLPGLTLAQVPPRAAIKYRADLIRSARLAFGLDAPVAALAGQVHQESAWRPDARSPYAHGLAQFTPATAEWIAGQDAALVTPDTGNPVWALRALARYDRWLYDRATPSSDACDRWWATLRGYNGGLGHWLKEARLAAPATDRGALDAQCGRASRAAVHCRENLAYPRLILLKWQPLYASWGPGVKCA